MEEMINNQIESDQNADLFVSLPMLILKIYLQDRFEYIDVLDNEIKDMIISRIENVCKDTISMIKTQDFEKSHQ